MARARKAGSREVPPPLPPDRRTIGQLVAEAIGLYGGRFVYALPLGLVVATVNLASLELDRASLTLVFLAAGPAFTLAYAYAARLSSETSVALRTWLVALAVGTVVWIPAALLFPWFALAAVLWLALVGLSVPAAVVEKTTFAGSLRRGLALGRADYLHAAGSLATLVVLFVVARTALALVLDSQADNTVRTAIFLADTVLGPLLFLGGAVLYADQEARLRSARTLRKNGTRERGFRSRGRSGERRKERRAHLSDADHAHGEGRPDAEREPVPPARGQP